MADFTKIEPVWDADGRGVMGITFDPPLSWNEWDGAEESLETAAKGGDTEELRLRTERAEETLTEWATRISEVTQALEILRDDIDAKFEGESKAFLKRIRRIIDDLEDMS